MTLGMGLDWQLQTQSTLTVASKPKRNKLRRRRRPSPIRAMTVVANGVDHPDTPMSAAASSSPTLLENGRHDEKDKTLDEAQACKKNNFCWAEDSINFSTDRHLDFYRFWLGNPLLQRAIFIELGEQKAEGFIQTKIIGWEWVS